MQKDFLREMNVKQVIKYKKPCIITLSGLPGCGKTDIARTLSKELQIFLLSNDYIRNYYYQFTNEYSEEKRLEIEEYVNKLNKQRLQKLLLSRTSFIYDRDFNLKRDFKKFEIAAKILQLQLIKIKVNSSDEDNISRIARIQMDYNHIFDGVIGDNVEYLSSFPEEVYYQIKERKPQLISDNYFDYVINTYTDDLDSQVDIMMQDIKTKRLERIINGKRIFK